MLRLGFGFLFFVIVACTGLGAPGPEAPLHYSKAEVRKEIAGVVEAQLAAFAADDFTKAYSFAARGLRQQFTERQFQVMITRGYPVVVHHKRADLGLPMDNGTTATLPVEILSNDGRVISYRYLLVREDGTWKVTGVLENKPRASDA